MDSGGFSSNFPVGLRVLVVDDDPTWLKILEKMLKKCNYEVKTCSLAREALNLLRKKRDGFDIVISDVNMPDMDGFKLLELVGLEMDLPVIMMSVDGETNRVMKGVQHGACDYLLKPIRMKELKNIWQHVFRKRVHEGVESYLVMKNFGEDFVLGKRKKDDEKASSSCCTNMMKKQRVIWTVDLHQKFVQAVNQIGFDKVGPKKILDLMGVPWLTRENVASHLQKYRLFLNRLEGENAMKAAFTGTKATKLNTEDHSLQISKENHNKTEASKVNNFHMNQQHQSFTDSSSKMLGFSEASGVWDQDFSDFCSTDEFYTYYNDLESLCYGDKAEANDVFKFGTEYQVTGKDVYIS